MDLFISIAELKFLLENLNHNKLLKLLNNAKKKGEYLAKKKYAAGKYLLELTENQAEELKENISMILIEKGVGDDGELNAFGFQLEGLIDRLHRLR